jgi:hypothetical protein
MEQIKIADSEYERAIAEYIAGFGFDEEWLMCHLTAIKDRLDEINKKPE